MTGYNWLTQLWQVVKVQDSGEEGRDEEEEEEQWAAKERQVNPKFDGVNSRLVLKNR